LTISGAYERTQIAPAFFQGDQRGGEEPFGLRRIAAASKSSGTRSRSH
jgi:hypothetical protein